MADGIGRTSLRPFSGPAGDVSSDSANTNAQNERDSAIKQYQTNNNTWKRVLNRLESVSQTGFGKKDWKTHFWIAKINSKNNIIEKAFPAVEKAERLAQNQAETSKTTALLTYLKNNFGPVKFTQDNDQKNIKEGYITLTTQNPLINLEKKKAFETIRHRFGTEKMTLPQTLYLPFGQYRANAVSFEIKTGENEMAKASLFLFATSEIEQPTDWGMIGTIGGLVLIGVVGVVNLLSPAEQQKGEVR